MIDALDCIPASVRPQALSLPVAVADALSGMGRMQAVATPADHFLLMRRLDSKYSVPRVRLPQLLDELSGRFTVLGSAGQYAARYVTVYFDSAECRFLHDHLRGRRPRHKLRVRHYLERRLSSLEIKSKMPGGRTDKQLRAHEFASNALDADDCGWAARVTGLPQPVHAQAWSSCQRITLLHAAASCRLTIDLNVALGSARGARVLRDRALLELKRERAHGDVRLTQSLLSAGARPIGLSKYVAAMMDAGASAQRARFATVLGPFARADVWQECRA